MAASQPQPANPVERLTRLMELRCRQEILQRWLASEVLTQNLQQSLRIMLVDVEEQLGRITRRSAD
jgi:hypothetical protein